MCVKNKEATWVVFWDKVKKTVNFLESEGDIYLASDDVTSLIGHIYGFGLENTAEEEVGIHGNWEQTSVHNDSVKKPKSSRVNSRGACEWLGTLDRGTLREDSGARDYFWS